MSRTARIRVNRAPQQVISVLAGVALSLALVKWGVTRRMQGTSGRR